MATRPAAARKSTPPPPSAVGRPMSARAEQFGDVRKLLESYSARMATLLPRTLPPSRMLQLVTQEIARNPGLLECTRNSLVGCVLQMAQLGLEPGGVLGEAYLIPRNNRKTGKKDCTFIAGYRGLMKLARQSGEVVVIEAHVVYERDHFEFRFGTDPFLRFVPANSGDALVDGQNIGRGKITHAFAMATLRNSSARPFEVMDRVKIEAARASSPAARDESGPWITHYDEMCAKTVVRHLCKFLPADQRLHTAVGLDEKADAGIPQDLGATWDVNEDGSVSPASESEGEPPAEGQASAENASQAQPQAQQLPEGQAPVELKLESREPVPVERRPPA